MGRCDSLNPGRQKSDCKTGEPGGDNDLLSADTAAALLQWGDRGLSFRPGGRRLQGVWEDVRPSGAQ